MIKCKHFSTKITPNEEIHKCDINKVDMGFPKIKEEYERLYSPKKAAPNGDCMFIQDTNDLTKCPCFEEK